MKNPTTVFPALSGLFLKYWSVDIPVKLNF